MVWLWRDVLLFLSTQHMFSFFETEFHSCCPGWSWEIEWLRDLGRDIYRDFFECVVQDTQGPGIEYRFYMQEAVEVRQLPRM